MEVFVFIPYCWMTIWIGCYWLLYSVVVLAAANGAATETELTGAAGVFTDSLTVEFSTFSSFSSFSFFDSDFLCLC